MSQLVCYSITCTCIENSDFLDRAQLLTQILLKQDYDAPRLKSSVQKFKGRLLRNIDFPGGNGFFPFYVDWFFSLSPTRILLALTL